MIPILPRPLGAIAASPTTGQNPEQFISLHYEFSKIATKSRGADFAVSLFSESEHCAAGMPIRDFGFWRHSPVFAH
jgi:hypothetical protein